MTDSLLGKRLDGRYDVVHKLAVGGFGQTYIAHDSRRPGYPRCVVKLLQPACNDLEFLENARRLFNTEAETLESLGNHKQIPRLLAYFEEDEEFYLVQEYVEGSLLTEELLIGQSWKIDKVLSLLREVLEILRFIHSHNVIHRDIKPDNIIRRRYDDSLVLVDFGTVKQIRTRVAVAGQATATISVGTPGYMPTEQSHGKPRPSSDIYALGIILIQAVTGLHPNQLQENEETGELMWQSWANCDDDLIAIIKKMVHYHFRDRYRSASETLQALNRYLSLHPELGNSASSGSLITSSHLRKQEITDYRAQPIQTIVAYAPVLTPRATVVVEEKALAKDKSENREGVSKETQIARLPDDEGKSPTPATTKFVEKILGEIALDKSETLLSNVEEEKTVDQNSPVAESPFAAHTAFVSIHELTAQNVSPKILTNSKSANSSENIVSSLSAIKIARANQSDETEPDRGCEGSLEVLPSKSSFNLSLPRISLPPLKVFERSRTQVTLVGFAGLGLCLGLGWFLQNRNALSQAEETLRQGKQFYTEQSYEDCVSIAQSISSRYQDTYQEAQNLLGSCWLAQAHSVAMAHKLKDAIVIAQNIQPSMTDYDVAQTDISKWSKNIFEIAVNNYSASKYEDAKSIMLAIPNSAGMSDAIEEKLSAWKKEQERNEKGLAAAKEAIKKSEWSRAIQEVEKITFAETAPVESSSYWEKHIKPIIQKARQEIAAIEEAQKAAAEAERRAAAAAPVAPAPVAPAPIAPVPQAYTAAEPYYPPEPAYTPPPSYTPPAPSYSPPAYSPPAYSPPPAASGGDWQSEQR